MIQAIRIEHTDGVGMFIARNRDGSLRDQSVLSGYYNAETDYSIKRSIWERHDQFPALYLDIKNATGDHFCAYKSIDQLKEWLTTEEIVYLKSLGYSVYLLELETALIGEYQIAYKKTDIITKQDITQLFV